MSEQLGLFGEPNQVKKVKKVAAPRRVDGRIGKVKVKKQPLHDHQPKLLIPREASPKGEPFGMQAEDGTLMFKLGRPGWKVPDWAWDDYCAEARRMTDGNELDRYLKGVQQAVRGERCSVYKARLKQGLHPPEK